MFKNSLFSKIVLIFTIPVLGILYFSFITVMEKVDTLNDFKKNEIRIDYLKETQNVILSLEKEKILTNFKQINDRFLETNHRFYEEVLKLQTQIFILEMWNLFANEYEKRKHSLQTGNQYEHFISLLQEHCLQHREVKFYSDLLNISPKYLNYLSKTHSGITASEWIKRHAKERIILLLQNNNLNISEISEEMNFSSYSYFTRYVKKLLGVTPGEFRGRFNSK